MYIEEAGNVCKDRNKWRLHSVSPSKIVNKIKQGHKIF